ncbi:MAG: XdhC family protein [Bacillota bacterium]
MKDFFKKISEQFSSSHKVITAVLTGFESDNLDENLLGEMMLIDEKGEIEFSSEKMEAEISRYIIEEEIKNELLNLTDTDKSELKNIELSSDEKIELFVEPVVDKPRLLVFGAGHIAAPLVKISSLIDFEITVIDDRDEFLNYDNFPNADRLRCLPYRDYFSDFTAQKNDYIVIVTRGHQFDYEVLKEVIRTDVKYIGMIGSSKKIKEVYTKLKEKDGISDSEFKKVHSPIGIKINSETPEEIAVAIAAELISVRRGKSA